MLNEFQMYTCMVNGHYAQYILKQYLFTNLKFFTYSNHVFVNTFYSI